MDETFSHHEGTKVTRGLDIYDFKLRVPFGFAQGMLRGLRGEIFVFFLIAALPRGVSVVNMPSQETEKRYFYTYESSND